MNIIKKFNAHFSAGQIDIITDRPRPAIGGWTANIYAGPDSVYALVSEPGKPDVLGVVPPAVADEARSIEFDPYDDGTYANRVIDLAIRALGRASEWQRGNRRHAGPCDLFEAP